MPLCEFHCVRVVEERVRVSLMVCSLLLQIVLTFVFVLSSGPRNRRHPTRAGRVIERLLSLSAMWADDDVRHLSPPHHHPSPSPTLPRPQLYPDPLTCRLDPRHVDSLCCKSEPASFPALPHSLEWDTISTCSCPSDPEKIQNRNTGRRA